MRFQENPSKGRVAIVLESVSVHHRREVYWQQSDAAGDVGGAGVCSRPRLGQFPVKGGRSACYRSGACG
eukprot:556426-Alexandrium_andersonii.AAC.1